MCEQPKNSVLAAAETQMQKRRAFGRRRRRRRVGRKRIATVDQQFENRTGAALFSCVCVCARGAFDIARRRRTFFFFFTRTQSLGRFCGVTTNTQKTRTTSPKSLYSHLTEAACYSRQPFRHTSKIGIVLYHHATL